MDKEAKKAELAIKLDSAKLSRAEKKENFALSEEITQKLAGQKAKLAEIKLQQAHFVAQDAREGQKIGVQAEANKIAKTTDTRYGMQVILPTLVNKFIAKNGREPNAAELEELKATSFTMSANLMKQYAGQRGGDQLEINKAKEGRERLDDFRGTSSYRELKRAAKAKGPEALQNFERNLEIEYGVRSGGGGSNVIQWDSIGGAK